MKLTLDEKLECVLLHLNGNLPLHTISKKEELMLLISILRFFPGYLKKIPLFLLGISKNTP